jgi:hypothetical protein
MDEIEAFLGECRGHAWFESRPEVVDRLENVLKGYLAGEGAEWQGIWDEVRAILGRRADSRASTDRQLDHAAMLQSLRICPSNIEQN